MTFGFDIRNKWATKNIPNANNACIKKYEKSERLGSYKFYYLWSYLKLLIHGLIYACWSYCGKGNYSLKEYQQISLMNNNDSQTKKIMSSIIEGKSKDLENSNLFIKNLNFVPYEKECYVTRGKDVVDTVIEAKCSMDYKEWLSVFDTIIKEKMSMDPENNYKKTDIKKLKDECIGEDDTNEINEIDENNKLPLSIPDKADSSENEVAPILKAKNDKDIVPKIGTSDNNVSQDVQDVAEQNNDGLPPEMNNRDDYIPFINDDNFLEDLNLGDNREIQVVLENADPDADIPENRQVFNEITDYINEVEHVPIPESNYVDEFEYFLEQEDGQIYLHLNPDIADANINDVLWMEMVMFFDDP